MLQNRVDPFGQLIRTPARGLLMGNRGLLHNEKKEIVRPFRLKAWITCLLEFKGRHRQVMTPNLYTELFFLDEVTAFAAGHRPCAECRRIDYTRFKKYWLAGNPGYGFNEKTPIRELDGIMQSERMDTDLAKITFPEKINALPGGVMLKNNGEAHLLWKNELWKWSPAGYEEGEMISGEKIVDVLTPRCIVNTFRAGYLPMTKIPGL